MEITFAIGEQSNADTVKTDGDKMYFHNPDLRGQSERHKRIYALYELAYTLIDASAALLFIVGSIMFFSSAWVYTGTWCFLVGSAFFATKPTLRVVREFHLLRLGDYEDLAERL